MVAQTTRPLLNGHHAANVLQDGLYTIDQAIVQTAHRSLFYGHERGVERPVLIEQIRDVPEALMLAALDHKQAVHDLYHLNLAQLVDAFIERNAFYTVMAVGATGVPLGEMTLTPAQVVAFGEDLCSVIGYLENHHQPFSSVDLTPSSVFITCGKRARLTALAGLLGLHAQTRHGHFTAPPGDETRALVFSLGATLHFAISKWPGIYAQGAPDLMTLHAEVTPELNRVIARALALAPTERYANLAELRQALLHL
jgi:hypothetical protein